MKLTLDQPKDCSAEKLTKNNSKTLLCLVSSAEQSLLCRFQLDYLIFFQTNHIAALQLRVESCAVIN